MSEDNPQKKKSIEEAEELRISEVFQDGESKEPEALHQSNSSVDHQSVRNSPKMLDQKTPPPTTIRRDSSKAANLLSSEPQTAPVSLFASAGRPAIVPTPKQPSKCPLFCCYYAEFDNKVGPRIRYQSPHHFMDQEIGVPIGKIHSILHDAFADLKASPPSFSETDKQNVPKPTTTISEERANESESLSIFDSCSEYIITGSALSGKLVNLSTHHLHILTRPTVIHDKDRYERNSLLFCVGFVLRRSEDPRPFRPVLSRLADTLCDLEVEHGVLSTPGSGTILQSLLEWTLLSLNSASWECNVQLSTANAVNVKLFHPPKPPVLPVSDFAVPVFLRRDWQVQSYDWDLAINWVSQHIDGVTNARQISKKAEVDLEMVQACLRVLRHHGVIALVDMFFFTNRYECTEKVARLLTGKEEKLLNDAADFVLRRPSSQSNNQNSSNTESSSLPHSAPLLGSSARFMFEPLYAQQQNAVGSQLDSSGSVRVGTPNSPQSQEAQMVAAVRRSGTENDEVKTALSELYAACHRGCSIGDLWLSLLSKEVPPGISKTVNWSKILSSIDIRRFTLFGQVNGIMKRVHDYPLLLDRHTVVASKTPVEYARSLLNSQPSSQNPGQIEWSHVLSKSESILRKKGEFKRKVGMSIDGRHCDDELVCLFEKSYEELLELFDGKKIVHVFAVKSPR